MGELRDAVMAIIREYIFGNDTPRDEVDRCVDAVLLMVQRNLAGAREQVAEEIVEDIVRDASSRPRAAEPFRQGMFTAAGIAREKAERLGEDRDE